MYAKTFLHIPGAVLSVPAAILCQKRKKSELVQNKMNCSKIKL